MNYKKKAKLFMYEETIYKLNRSQRDLILKKNKKKNDKKDLKDLKRAINSIDKLIMRLKNSIV